MATPDIDEINKIRKAIGLPLLPSANAPADDGPTFKDQSRSDDSDEEPASTLETREAAGYENYKQHQDEERRRIERARRKKGIQKARDAAARSSKLEGKGLGDIDDDGDLDAKAWLKGSRKRQAKIDKQRAEQLARELAERERLAAIEYKASDLAGVKVAHKIGDFENGESEQILTLQDAEIGNENTSDQEDVLENADIIARDRIKDKLELKTKKAYDVHDEAAEQTLLSQYDEKKRKAFTLDSQGTGIEERDAKRQQIGDELKSTISLDILKPDLVSDYMEIKVKKPKKSKKKNLRKRDEEYEDTFSTQNRTADDAMELDLPKFAPKPNEAVIDDDEDLASALAFSRKTTLKKQKRRPEDIVRQLKEEEEEEEEEARASAEVKDGLVLDDTTNFLDNLSSRPQDDGPRPKVHQSIEAADAYSPGENTDQAMQDVHAGAEDEEELLERMRREQKTHTPDISHSGLNEEESVSNGTAAALKLLTQRGLVKQTDAGDKNELYKDRQKFIINARLREYDSEQRARSQRERDRQSGKMSNMSLKEREEHARWQNTQRDHQTSLQAAAAFNREYKPDVQIKYVDETGRHMNQKEAFKHLSHQFHGKGSGKQKTEKHLKKLEDEKRRAATSVLDSSQATGMHNAAGAQSKKNKEAGVRLA